MRICTFFFFLLRQIPYPLSQPISQSNCWSRSGADDWQSEGRL